MTISRSLPFLLLAGILLSCNNPSRPAATAPEGTGTDTVQTIVPPSDTAQAVAVSCKDFEVEMGKGTECRYAGQQAPDVYKRLLGDYRDEAAHLLPALPTADTSYGSNANGEHVSVTYSISKSKSAISLSYEGGVTEMELSQDNDGTTTRVAYNAD